MGGLTAVVDNEGKNALSQALYALNILPHRGKDSFGASNGKEIYFSIDLTDLPAVKTHVGMAYGL
ncbi:hypothetical protein, partial [[Eubacterium] cellulosolvens]